MADENTAAESSPAPAVPTEAGAYANWRMTGKTPQPKASAAPKKEPSGAGEKPAESAPASEAGKQTQEKPRSTAETRLNELLADLKRAGFTPAELKTFKREAQQQAAEPKATPEQTVKPAHGDPPVKPKSDDAKFKSWEEYEAAKDQYYEDLAEYKSRKAIADHQAQQRAEEGQKALAAKFADAKQRYGDEAESTIVTTAQAIARDAQIAPAVKAMLDQSPVLTDLLYVMGAKPEDLQGFIDLARTNPAAAVRKLVLTEQLVAEELAKGGNAAGSEPSGEAPGRDASGKFTPAKKVTEAPPPPREASGRGTPPADEVETAGERGDFRAFQRAANRRDLARRKGNA